MRKELQRDETRRLYLLYYISTTKGKKVIARNSTTKVILALYFVLFMGCFNEVVKNLFSLFQE